MRFIAAVAPLSTFTATHRREGGVHKILQTALTVSFAWSVPAAAEQACVKYHKCVPLDRFACENITRSSFIHRVCYAAPHRYMIIWLGNGRVPYHYCNIGANTVAEFKAAPSMGRYFNSNIRSIGDRRGPFDCRDHAPPSL